MTKKIAFSLGAMMLAATQVQAQDLQHTDLKPHFAAVHSILKRHANLELKPGQWLQGQASMTGARYYTQNITTTTHGNCTVAFGQYGDSPDTYLLIECGGASGQPTHKIFQVDISPDAKTYQDSLGRPECPKERYSKTGAIARQGHFTKQRVAIDQEWLKMLGQKRYNCN